MTPPAGTANSTLPLNITRGNTPMTPPAGTANSTLPLNTPPSSDESPSPPSSETPPSPPSSSNSSNLVVGITVGTAVVLVFICGIIMLFRKRSPQRSKRSKVTVGPYDAHPPNDHVVSIPLPHAPIPSGSTSHVASPLAFSSRNSKFTYEELQRATGGFSDANRLGEGGFGPVHKGTLRNGKEVAVKQLKAGSGQGEREFQAEVEIISRVHHKHLVSLVGYCSTGSQRLLAYEFVPNNTLKFHLHGIGQPTMDWSTRRRIALGSAKGLAYLHEDCHPKIIHRDIKADNILLDFMFEAKVADFGIAKTTSDLNTHVSTRVMGTFGYMDPEYAGSGQLTDKSDVFSYGVVLLELLTGRVPIDKANPHMHVSLVEWARPFLMHALKGKNSRSFLNLVDPRLQNVFDRDEMTRMVACAEACTRQSAKDRPKMSQVARVLEGAVSIANLNPGVTRGPSRGYSRDYNSQQHREDMTKLKKIALDIKGKLKWK